MRRPKVHVHHAPGCLAGSAWPTWLAALALLFAGACAGPRPHTPAQSSRPAAATGQNTPPPAALRELLPGVRADFTRRLVEFDGTVPIDAHDPATPNVYLEVVVCTPNTREHESLVVSPVRPSDVHAALLAIGLDPGRPAVLRQHDAGAVIYEPPAGSPVRVRLLYRRDDGTLIEDDAHQWIVHVESRQHPPPGPRGHHWVFAGSRMVIRQGQERYDADGSGVLIGLAAFHSETIAYARPFSPDTWLAEPVWVADPARVPAFGTPVTVRIVPAEEMP